MSVLRLGSTQKFSDNWDNIFSKGKKKPAAKKTAKKKPAAKKTAKAKKKSRK